MREKLDLPLWEKGSCIFDVFAFHRSDEFLNLLANKKNTSCVRSHKQLQQMDLIPKKLFKQHMKNEFQHYYAQEIEKSLADTRLENVEISLKLPVIKEMLASGLQMLSKNCQHTHTHTKMIQRSVIAVGLD